jgi:hypothetical protein
MAVLNEKSSIFGFFIWGVKGERLYLKLHGHIPSAELALAMKRTERGGFCHSYGVIPVHAVAIAIPLAFNFAATELGFPQLPPIASGMPVLAAWAASVLPVRLSAVKKSGGGISFYVRKRQLKIYALSLLAAIAGTFIMHHGKSCQHENRQDIKPSITIRAKELAAVLPPAKLRHIPPFSSLKS